MVEKEPRFVVLEHHWNGVHWDFMLETGPMLRTWALAAAPGGSGTISARASADHRPLYLDYEGEISGGRGHVKRWDHGTFAWLRQDEGEIRIALRGEKLRGNAGLRRTSPEEWSFLWEAPAEACIA